MNAKSFPLGRGVAAFALVLGLGLWTVASAGTINIGTGVGTKNASGTLGSGDPNLIGTGGQLSIALQGSAAANASVLLALLFPAGSGFNPLGGITLYNFPWSPATPVSAGAANQAGTLTGGFLSQLVPGFSASDNFSNFQGFDNSLGLDTSSFSVVDWELATGPLNGHTNPLINIDVPNGEAAGSIFVALTDNGNSTVWTNAGGVQGPATSVPEPSTWVLLLAGLGLLAWTTRRRGALGKA